MMAAYAAVNSLKHTIHRLLNSSHSSAVLSSYRKAIIFAYEEAESLQEVLERLDGSSRRSSKRATVLDGQIRDAVHKLEDALESYVSKQFLPQSEGLGRRNRRKLFSIDRMNLKQEIGSFAKMVKKMRKECIKELSNPLPEKDVAASSIRTGSSGEQSKMVGLSDVYSKLEDGLRSGGASKDKVVSIAGMAGIGKTTLAKQVFEDFSKHFDCRAWVTIGPNYQRKETVQSIRDQVTSPATYKMLMEEDEEEDEDLFDKSFFRDLMSRRYLIVLDDIWDNKVWDDLGNSFPKNSKGSRVLLTTRLEEVSTYISNNMRMIRKTFSIEYHEIHQLRLLDKEESWHLLRKKVFAEESCPPQLEKVGKKIAECCEGLPLAIITVAKLLSKAKKEVKHWNKVAERQNSVFKKAYDKISKVLLPSYHHLPQHLKACFLYMGVFPQKYEISASKIINLWSAEGFLEGGYFLALEYISIQCLKNLVSNNVLMVHQYSYDSRIKTCGLHSAFWELCMRVARKNKFLHVLNSYGDSLTRSIEGQRRLCIHNNILFVIKDVYNSMASSSGARSLLCTGQYHPYPVPLCFGLRLLKVLEALTIRFYEFPVEVLNLLHLRYLALTYNGKLPASISKLWNLQFLIVRQHLSVKSSMMYLPMEIWDMKELKHPQIMGSDLPNPNGGACLESLLNLLDVSARSCTKGVLENIRHLKKLGIRIELGPNAAELLSCFDYVSNLSSLKSLKCVVVNPVLMTEVVAPPPALLSMFPSCLKKLSLSGFGYGWEDMSEIASLPYLEVLKLRCYAFRGPEWRPNEEKFWRLQYLLIEDTDLVHWRCDYICFPSLERLIIRHCYKLEKIPEISQFHRLQTIEVVDSTPSVVTWTKQGETKPQDSFWDGHLDSIFGKVRRSPQWRR